MKEVMVENGYYCYHLSKVCMQFCHVLKIDPVKGYWIDGYRPTTTAPSPPFWLTHEIHDYNVSDITKISKELFESVDNNRRERRKISPVFRTWED